MTAKCPQCGKDLVVPNSGEDAARGDLVIKSRLVFLNEDGNVLCRCPDCKAVVGLPLSFTASTIQTSPDNHG